MAVQDPVESGSTSVESLAGGIAAIAPESALGRGTFDPLALLIVWCARKSFYGILWLGLAIAVLTGKLNDVSTDASSLASDLGSPLVVVWIALCVRLAAAGAGLALAYPVAHAQQGHLTYRAGLARWIDVVLDRWRLTRSLNAFRWTYPVRAEAIRRLGSTGATLSLVGRMINILNNVLLVVLIGVVLITSQ